MTHLEQAASHRVEFDEFTDAYNACHDALDAAERLAFGISDQSPHAEYVTRLLANIKKAQAALVEAPA